MYKLNLVMSYPIKWNLYKVFRDYVQNFFDSVGSDSFHKSFTDLAAGVINQWKKLQEYESMWRELWQSFENDTRVCRKEQIC